MAFRIIARLLAALALALLLFAGWTVLAPRSGQPRPRIDLGDPPGLMTSARIAALGSDAEGCRAVLDQAGVSYRPGPARTEPVDCAYDDAVTWQAGGSREARYRPAAPALACPLAAGLALWEWEVAQPAAVALLGSPIVAIDHFGSVACRRVYGRAAGRWSQHARARAIDVAGFRLADGRRITVARDWAGGGSEAAFLHRVRDGACRIFSTTLSPDYNAAHRDHLHLDEAGGGWGFCR